MGSDAGSIFEPVTLSWRGEDFEVPAERCMKLAYVVETALTQGGRMTVFQALQNPPITAVAMAYGAALRHAGAVASDEAVYGAILQSLQGSGDVAADMQGLIGQIMDMLMPPKAMSASASESDGKKKRGGSSPGSTPPA